MNLCFVSKVSGLRSSVLHLGSCLPAKALAEAGLLSLKLKFNPSIVAIFPFLLTFMELNHFN